MLHMFKGLLVLALFVVVIVLVSKFALQGFSWGSLTLSQPHSITVSGYAQKQQTNQLASFTASVEASNANKQTAIDEVGTKMTALMAELEKLGIPKADIQTQRVVVDEREDWQVQTTPRPKKWYASNTIEITVRDAAKVETLGVVLANSGATNVSGPNYRPDETKRGDDLLALAVENARVKAEDAAKSQGLSLGKIISVNEGGGSNPMPYPMAFSAMTKGSADSVSIGPITPGTTQQSASVVVVFELK